METFRELLIKRVKDASINAYGEAYLTDHEEDDFITKTVQMVEGLKKEKFRVSVFDSYFDKAYNRAISDVVKLLRGDK